MIQIRHHLCKGSMTSTLYQADNCIDEQLAIRLEAICGKHGIVLFLGFAFSSGQTEGLSSLGVSETARPEGLTV